MKIHLFKHKPKHLEWVKTHKFVLFCIAFAMVFLAGICWGRSGDKIGVVDMSQVYAKALVFQNIRSEQTAFEDEWKKEALAQKEELEEADKALSSKKRFLKKAEFDRRVAELKTRILDFQNQQMARLDLIRYQSGRIQQQVEQSMAPMIETVAEEKNLSFVLSASNVLYHNKAVDVTDEVIEELDDAFNAGRLPSLEVNLEEGE